MLDLGSHINILSNKSWEIMDKPLLVFSIIQLRLANQYRIYLKGFLENIQANLGEVKTITNFKVIMIVDKKDMYPTLLGFEWENYNTTMLS